MGKIFKKKDEKKEKMLRYEGGRVYFTGMSERRFFFVLTLVMLLLGILVRFGLF